MEEPVINNLEIIQGSDYPSTDPFTINNIEIEGDLLKIGVCYGGCAQHEWTLLTNKFYKKSFPPQLGLFLVHNQHGDNCKRQDCDTLAFNISGAKYPGKDKEYTVIISLNNTDKKINYEY
jgi:hypothetical protein